MTTSDIAEVKDLDRQFADAALKGDLSTLSRILADEVIYVHANGAIDTKQSFIAALASGSRAYLAIDSLDVDARLIGDVAVLTSLTRLHVKAGGSELDLRARFLRVYIRGTDGWKLTYHQGTGLK